jgi:aspartate aminotransferase-like enzyme
VIVSYTSEPEIKSGARFAQAGVQVAGGVPLMCGERDDYMSFRIGLFGLEKLRNVDACVERFAAALPHVSP